MTGRLWWWQILRVLCEPGRPHLCPKQGDRRINWCRVCRTSQPSTNRNEKAEQKTQDTCAHMYMWWPLWVLRIDVSCLQGPDTSQGGTVPQQPQAGAAQGGQQLRVPTFLVNAGQPNEVRADITPLVDSHPAAYRSASFGARAVHSLGTSPAQPCLQKPLSAFLFHGPCCPFRIQFCQISLRILLGLHRTRFLKFHMLGGRWRLTFKQS